MEIEVGRMKRVTRVFIPRFEEELWESEGFYRPKLVKSRRKWIFSLIIWAILLLLGVATGLLYAIRQWNWLGGTIEEDLTLWDVFFSVFGLTYAILMGLLLVEAHRRWGDLSSTVHREINALAGIIDLLHIFDNDSGKGEAKEKVILALKKYVQQEFWSQQGWTSQMGKIPYRRENVNDIYNAVCNLEPEPKNIHHECALKCIIDRVTEITSCRLDRIDYVRQKIHWTFYGLLLFMSLVIIIGFCLLDVQQGYWLHWGIVFITSLALYSMFNILRDIDRPVRGFWNIEEEARDTTMLILRDLIPAYYEKIR